METIDYLTTQQKADPEQHNYNGTITFVWWGYLLRAVWYADDDVDPLAIIHQAGSALAGILEWRFWVDNRQKTVGGAGDALESYSIKKNFMTRETFLDSIISLMCRILVFIMYRDDPRLRNWKVIGNRISSCFCEHLNQFVRNKQTNTTGVTAWVAVVHVKHYLAQLIMDAKSDFDLPEAKRGVSHQMKAGGVAASKAPPGYYDGLTDANIEASLDHAMESSSSWLHDHCHFSEEITLENREQFFSAPCLHFPKAECFKHYISSDGDPSPAHPLDLDDRDNLDDDDEPCDEIDQSDHVMPSTESTCSTECSAVLQEVMDLHLQAQPDASPTVESSWREIARLLSDFNQYSLALQLQQSRQTRFHVRELFDKYVSAHAQRDEDDWDFIHVAADVAVLIRVDGVLSWRLGNVEGIRTLKSEPTEKTQLDSCETLSHPTKVQVNDLKAAFQVRWFKECDPDGNVLDGVQNEHHACLYTCKCLKKCKAHGIESCHLCCREPIVGRTFFLPMQMDRSIANEPVVEIAACTVMDAVQMIKCDKLFNVWSLGCGNKEMIMTKFIEAGGLPPKARQASKAPLPAAKAPAAKAPAAKAPAAKAPAAKAPAAKVTCLGTPRPPSPHALDEHWHRNWQDPEFNLVGCTVHVYWETYGKWFCGRVTARHRQTPTCIRVLYTDNDHQWQNFSTMQWVLACIDTRITIRIGAQGTVALEEFRVGAAEHIIVDKPLTGRKALASVRIKRRELVSAIGPGCWLSDSVMELCMNMLAQSNNSEAIKHFFYAQLVQTGIHSSQHTRPLYKGTSLQNFYKKATHIWTKDKLFVAIHINCGVDWKTAIGEHWTLAVVDIKKHAFRYYDPWPGPYTKDQETQCIKNLKVWIGEEHPMEWVGSTEASPLGVYPTQGNKFDCGVFTLMYALCETLDIPLRTLPFGQQHLPMVREQLTAMMLSRAEPDGDI
jgi:hypothetical protein